MELKDLENTCITIECGDKKTAYTIVEIYKKTFPNCSWMMLDDSKCGTTRERKLIINSQISKPILNVSSDIFAKLFLKPKEERKEQAINGVTPIDWEQRRYEIAKDILAANQNKDQGSKDNLAFNKDEGLRERKIETSLAFADALIERLKKEEIC